MLAARFAGSVVCWRVYRRGFIDVGARVTPSKRTYVLTPASLGKTGVSGVKL